MVKQLNENSFIFADWIRELSLRSNSVDVYKGTVVLAMVRGEVHEMGKTVIKALFRANFFKIVDLGVIDSADDIIQAVKDNNADIVGLSCMLTSSLEEVQKTAAALEEHNLDINFFVGGPGLTPAMTATYIAPLYTQGITVYVRDLYDCHTLCNKVVNDSQRSELQQDVIVGNEKERLAFKELQTNKTLLSIDEAREKGLKIDWDQFEASCPKFLGIRVFEDFDLSDIVHLVDWVTVFLAFGLKGKYPQIFNDPKIGKTAKQVFKDAKHLMDDIIQNKKLKAQAVIGFFKANSIDDDIEIYAQNGRTIGVLHTLRQQALHDDKKPYYALSDFIAPKGKLKGDYIGAFALTCGIGLDELEKPYKDKEDDYHLILIKVLSDCLAEAFAEHMHTLVRKEYWGYAKDEQLTKEDMFRCSFQGIRPAPGYPACPEHSEKELLFKLLEIKNKIAMKLTAGYAMSPASSVCGFYFSHPESKYFWLGSVAKDQVIDYAARKKVDVDFVEKQLQMHLNYIKQ